MKRLLVPLLLLLLLSGCSGKAYREVRELESFQVVRTLGVDYADGRYIVTAALNGGSEETSVLKSEAATLALAMRLMQERSARRYVFFGHTEHYLVGEAAAEHDLSACLEYVERGYDMRLDTKLFIVKGGSAEAAIVGAVESGADVSEHLQAMEKDVQLLSGNHVFDCGDVAEALAEDGDAVVTAVSLLENEAAASGNGGKNVFADGYAVIVGGRLTAYADEDASRGVTLLMNNFVSDTAEVPDGAGGYTAVELTDGRVKYSAVFSDGELEKIRVCAHFKGNISEMESPIDIYNKEKLGELEHFLANEEIRRIKAAIELGRELGTDIAGLGRELELAHPVRLRGVSDWAALLAGADVEISAEVEIERSYELGVSPGEKEAAENEK